MTLSHLREGTTCIPVTLPSLRFAEKGFGAATLLAAAWALLVREGAGVASLSSSLLSLRLLLLSS